MMSLPKPDVILTHESDLDGFVAGMLLQRLAARSFGEEPRLEMYHYDSWKQRPLKENAAWVADFTFEERLDKANWVVFDHHPTQCTPKYARLIHDPSKSAGSLVYDWCGQHGLGSPQLDRLVHLNNVADLFLARDPDFFTALDYAGLVKTYQFRNLYSLIGNQLEKLLDHPLLEVMAVKRRVEDPLGFAWCKEHVSALAPTVGYVETLFGDSNYILHQLLEQQATPFSALLTLLRKSNGLVVVSVRSRNGEAIKVASLLQGGGHANAAGATLPRSVQRIPDAVAYLKKVLNPAPAPVQRGAADLDSAF